MPPLEFVRAAGAALGFLLAIPALVLVARLFTFLGRSIGTLDRIATAMDAVTVELKDHGVRLAVAETRIEALEAPERSAAPAPHHGFPSYRPEAPR